MRFKKLFAGLISLAAALIAVCAITVCASAEESGDYSYNVLSDGTVKITGYTGSATDLTIPATIDGKKVTSIGDYAFEKCSSLESIIIPDSVASIGEGAFWGCSSLTSVSIPDGVTDLKDFVFYVCSSLTSIDIPDSVTSIGYNAFSGCSNLKSINIPESVTSIGQTAFNYTALIKDQTTTLKYADNWIIGCDESATSVTIKSGTVGIAADTFSSCAELTKIYIPSGLKYITNPIGGRFVEIQVDSNNKYFSLIDGVLFNKSATELIKAPNGKKSYKIPNGVTSISDGAFSYCNSLASITIPDGVTSIGDYAFYYCENLTSIEIPDSVTSIGSYAFNGCSSLTSITIPDSVTSIGSYAFSDTPFFDNQTTTVKYAGKWVIGCDYNATSASIKSDIIGIADSAFLFFSLTEITIPDSVISIGELAFGYCKNLKSITIPDSVTSIGEYAFLNCSSLTSITIPDSVTSIEYGIFSDCPEDLIIYGYKDSFAEQYAKDNEINFVVIEPKPTVGNISKFSLDSRGVNSLKLSWSKASGATGYELEIQKNGTWSKAATINSGATVSYTITGLSAGTYYPLRVRAFVKSGGNTVYSAWKTGSANTSPSNMTGFKLASRGVNSVKLSWTKNTSASGYQVGVYKGGKWVSYTVKGSGTTSYTVSGLSAGTKYNVRIRAYKTNGSSTIYGVWKTGSVNTSPSNMTGFKLASRGVNSVKLSWTKNTSASGYQVGVYKGGKWVSYTVKGNSTTSYTVKSLSAGTKYNVRVRAYKTNGSSTIYGAWKTGSVNTSPSNMTGFKLKSKTTSSMTLQWSKNSSATGYQLQIQKNGKWVSYTIKSAKTTSYTIKSLAKNTKYSVRIRAYKTSGSSTIYGAWKNGSASTKK